MPKTTKPRPPLSEKAQKLTQNEVYSLEYCNEAASLIEQAGGKVTKRSMSEVIFDTGFWPEGVTYDDKLTLSDQWADAYVKMNG